MNLVERVFFRPLSTIGLITSVYTMMVGLGFLFFESYKQGLLYKNISQYVNPKGFGIAMLVIGLLTGISYMKRNDRLISCVGELQILAWVGITAFYFVGGQFFIGIIGGASWAVLNAYVSFAYRNRDLFEITKQPRPLDKHTSV